MCDAAAIALVGCRAVLLSSAALSHCLPGGLLFLLVACTGVFQGLPALQRMRTWSCWEFVPKVGLVRSILAFGSAWGPLLDLSCFGRSCCPACSPASMRNTSGPIEICERASRSCLPA